MSEDMTTEEAERLEEYKMLRDEMQNCIERDNTLATFMVTAVATILTFAVTANLQVPFLFLISFCIIIPFTARLVHYKKNVARISTYVIVFLEKDMNIKYETRNVLVKPVDAKPSKILISMRNYIGFWLGLISYIIYIVEYNNKVNFPIELDILFLVAPIILVIITFFMDKKIDSFSKEKSKWLENWTKLKEENDK